MLNCKTVKKINKKEFVNKISIHIVVKYSSGINEIITTLHIT